MNLGNWQLAASTALGTCFLLANVVPAMGADQGTAYFSGVPCPSLSAKPEFKLVYSVNQDRYENHELPIEQASEDDFGIWHLAFPVSSQWLRARVVSGSCETEVFNLVSIDGRNRNLAFPIGTSLAHLTNSNVMVAGLLPDVPGLTFRIYDDSFNPNLVLRARVIVDDGAFYFPGVRAKYTLEIAQDDHRITSKTIDCSKVARYSICRSDITFSDLFGNALAR